MFPPTWRCSFPASEVPSRLIVHRDCRARRLFTHAIGHRLTRRLTYAVNLFAGELVIGTDKDILADG
jgi:hypothetical protein